MIAENQVITVETIKQVADYILELEFNDNTKKTIDFYPFLSTSRNPMIRKYLSPEAFSKFEVLEGDLEWNDYDLCFPVADLYEERIMG